MFFDVRINNGFTTYKTSKEMPDDLLNALPPVNELKKLLDDTSTQDEA